MQLVLHVWYVCICYIVLQYAKSSTCVFYTVPRSDSSKWVRFPKVNFHMILKEIQGTWRSYVQRCLWNPCFWIDKGMTRGPTVTPPRLFWSDKARRCQMYIWYMIIVTLHAYSWGYTYLSSCLLYILIFTVCTALLVWYTCPYTVLWFTVPSHTSLPTRSPMVWHPYRTIASSTTTTRATLYIPQNQSWV